MKKISKLNGCIKFSFKEKQMNQIGSWKYNVNKLQDILNTILIHQIKKEKPDIIFLTPGAAYTLDKDILTFAKIVLTQKFYFIGVMNCGQIFIKISFII